jgi:hypothetical protein
MSGFDGWVIDQQQEQQERDDSHQQWIQDYEHQEQETFGSTTSKEINMGRYTQETGKAFQQAPTGNHAAVCIALTDLGTQHGEYQGEPTVRNQVMLTWELCGEKMTDGRPFTVSAFLTNSLNEKSKLRAYLVSWRGRDFTPQELKKFDLQSVLGAPCLVSVVENEKGKAAVSGVARLPKGMEKPEPTNPLRAFWIAEWDQEAFDALSPGIQKIIMESDEYKKRAAGPAGMKDDIPWAEENELADVPF